METEKKIVTLHFSLWDNILKKKKKLSLEYLHKQIYALKQYKQLF